MLLIEQNARAAFRIADRGYALRPGGVISEVTANGHGSEPAHAYGLVLSRQEATP